MAKNFLWITNTEENIHFYRDSAPKFNLSLHLFRHKRIKNRGIVPKTQCPLDNKRKFEEIMVENLWFPRFLLFVIYLPFKSNASAHFIPSTADDTIPPA